MVDVAGFARSRVPVRVRVFGNDGADDVALDDDVVTGCQLGLHRVEVDRDAVAGQFDARACFQLFLHFREVHGDGVAVNVYAFSFRELALHHVEVHADCTAAKLDAGCGLELFLDLGEVYRYRVVDDVDAVTFLELALHGIEVHGDVVAAQLDTRAAAEFLLEVLYHPRLWSHAAGHARGPAVHAVHLDVDKADAHALFHPVCLEVQADIGFGHDVERYLVILVEFRRAIHDKPLGPVGRDLAIAVHAPRHEGELVVVGHARRHRGDPGRDVVVPFPVKYDAGLADLHGPFRVCRHHDVGAGVALAPYPLEQFGSVPGHAEVERHGAASRCPVHRHAHVRADDVDHRRAGTLGPAPQRRGGPLQGPVAVVYLHAVGLLGLGYDDRPAVVVEHYALRVLRTGEVAVRYGRVVGDRVEDLEESAHVDGAGLCHVLVFWVNQVCVGHS